jgi:hypothetical protein
MVSEHKRRAQIVFDNNKLDFNGDIYYYSNITENELCKEIEDLMPFYDLIFINKLPVHIRSSTIIKSIKKE